MNDTSAFDARSFFAKMMDTLWIQRDTSQIASFFLPEARVKGVIADTELTAEEMVDAIAQISLLARVDKIELINLIEGSEGCFAAHMNFTLTALRTGATAPQDVAVFCKLRDGKISEYTAILDFLSFQERAGLLPEGSAMMLLAGEPLSST
ncbi:hypothetical protein ACS3SW_03230 [Roseobacteraceae bacterium S113]